MSCLSVHFLTISCIINPVYVLSGCKLSTNICSKTWMTLNPKFLDYTACTQCIDVDFWNTYPMVVWSICVCWSPPWDLQKWLNQSRYNHRANAPEVVKMATKAVAGTASEALARWLHHRYKPIKLRGGMMFCHTYIPCMPDKTAMSQVAYEEKQTTKIPQRTEISHWTDRDEGRLDCVRCRW